MIIIVTGSRDWPYPHVVQWALYYAKQENPGITIRHGDCKTGADAQAEFASKMIQLPTDPMPANFRLLGKAAGPIRNRQMFEKEPRPGLVIGFCLNHSRGTQGTLNLARETGTPWIRYDALSSRPGEIVLSDSDHTTVRVIDVPRLDPRLLR